PSIQTFCSFRNHLALNRVNARELKQKFANGTTRSEGMRHVSTEHLINYIEGLASGTEMTVEAHLTSCSDCAEVKQELQSLISRLREETSFEPPTDLVQWGVNLFQPVLRANVGGLPKLIAALILD